MKMKHGLLMVAALALMGTGCDEDVGAGDLALSIQLSSAVADITSVRVSGATGGKEASTLITLTTDGESLLLSALVEDLPAGKYSLSISGFVGDATAPAASTTATVTIKADEVATAALQLGPAPELTAQISSSNNTPKTGEVVTFTATVAGPGADTAALIWSDDCGGGFVTNGAASVEWSSRTPDGCTITLEASTGDAVTTTTLELGVTPAKGTVSLVVGAGACTAPVYPSSGESMGVWDSRGHILTGDETARNFPLTRLNGLAIDSQGRLLIPEREAGRLWRWNPKTDRMEHLAGIRNPNDLNATISDNGDPATMETFDWTFDVAVDNNTGNIFLMNSGYDDEAYPSIIYADTMTSEVIWGNPNDDYATGIAVDAAGDIYIAGGSGWSLDKLYTSNMQDIYDETVDYDDMWDSSCCSWGAWDTEVDGEFVYFSHRWENAVFKQSIYPFSEPMVVAGLYSIDDEVGQYGFSGDGGPAVDARLGQPRGLYVVDGVVYIADTQNHRIRKVAKDGTISTVVETGGAVGDLVLDADKNIYFTDRHNCSVFKVQGPY